MNILFINKDKVLPNNGGTERITYSVGRALKELYGCRIYSMYMFDNQELSPELFDGVFLFNRQRLSEDLSECITRHAIDAVIVQGYFDLVEDISRCTASTATRLIFVHHFEPAWELRFNCFGDYWSRMKNAKGLQFLMNAIHCLFYPITRRSYISKLRVSYKKAYELSDKVVLLSSTFINGFMNFGMIADKAKFEVIPNILSYEKSLPEAQIRLKKNHILVVSRMDEVQKRISLVLNIWKKCSTSELFDGWTLDIVGAGPDLDTYKNYVEKEKIQRVKFHGRQEPTDFYVNSSIFMMTSKSEGWGLTLTEAQNFGVIPIAMDTYSSLHDIITDGINGYIVKDNDIDTFIERLSMLVGNKDKRSTIAFNCINSVNRFSSDNIGGLWIKLLQS